MSTTQEHDDAKFVDSLFEDGSDGEQPSVETIFPQDDGLAPADSLAEEFNSNQEQATTEETSESEATESKEEKTLPEKYRNKSIEEIIEMHQNAEKAMHQKANDLNQVEKRLMQGIDDVLSRKLDGSKQEDKPAITMDELLENPQEAILKVVSSLNKQEADQPAAGQAEVLMTEEDFMSRHNDADAIGKSEEFANWIQAAPARSRRLSKALESNDYDAADELLVSFKEVHPGIQAKKEEAQSQREEAAKTLSGTRSSHAGSGADSRTIRASTIENLIVTNRAKYDELNQPGGAIYEAYREGRVIED